MVAIIIGLIAASPFLFVFIAFKGPNEREIRLLSQRADTSPSRLRESFDSTSWKTSLTSDSLDPIRLRMVDDLLHRHRLRGMTREEVVSLLGKPPETNYFPEYDLVYWLGSERGYNSIVSEWWLVIKFGGDGRVSKTALVRG
ncbi:MAG TPA: hypothetical protein VGL29_16920 [Blastocatellia bacterium]